MKLLTNENIGSKLAVLISLMLYFVLGYFTQRTEPILLLSAVAFLFAIYFYIVRKSDVSESTFNILLLSALLFRLIFILATPSLSDDYFRFIWDGRLIVNGINPFSHLPEYIYNQTLLSGAENIELYTRMNSPHYYSVYPPVLQVIFFISSKLSFGNNFTAIVILRLFILCAEFGTVYFLKKILYYLELPKTKIFVYLLNPLVIIELSGNLHFEAVMLFFIVGSFYYLLINNLIYSSILFALAVSTKMIPLVLLPLIVRKVGLKSGIIYSLISFAVVVVLFIPFIDHQLVSNIGNSVGLYFQKFEFNASVYYLFREIGFYFTGYNAIGIIGKALPLISLIVILIITFRFEQKNTEAHFFNKVVEILVVYYLFSLIVHPWYISFLVLISVFSTYRFVLVWSALIFGSYITYSTLPYRENMWVVTLEYSIILLWFFFERKKIKIYSNP